MEGTVRSAGLPHAVVRPTLYLDNLLKPSALRDIVEHGVFSPPIPARQRIAWTLVEDCAEAAVLLIRHGVDGGDHRIAGPDSLGGEEFAARLSAGFGRAVRYERGKLPAFEAELAVAMPAELARQVASKFRYFAAHPKEADAILARPFAPAANRIPGFRPTTVETWARRHRALFEPGEIGTRTTEASSSCP